MATFQFRKRSILLAIILLAAVSLTYYVVRYANEDRQYRTTCQFLIDDEAVEYRDGLHYFLFYEDVKGKIVLPIRRMRGASFGFMGGVHVEERDNITVMFCGNTGDRVFKDMNFKVEDAPSLFSSFYSPSPIRRVFVAHKSQTQGRHFHDPSKKGKFTEYATDDVTQKVRHIHVFASYLEKNGKSLIESEFRDILNALQAREDEEERERNRVR